MRRYISNFLKAPLSFQIRFEGQAPRAGRPLDERVGVGQQGLLQVPGRTGPARPRERQGFGRRRLRLPRRLQAEADQERHGQPDRHK